MAWLALGTLYLVWGTGCLAIKVCLDGGFGPFGLGVTRLGAAALLLLGFAVVRRAPLERRELPVILGTGALYWVLGSGLQVWGQQTVSSGAAALVLGLTPLVGALFTGITRNGAVGLVLGLVGLGLAVDGPLGGVGLVALGLSAVTCAVASQALGEVRSHAAWVAGLQLGSGALGQLVALVLSGEALPVPTPEAFAAWTWLVLGPAVVGMLAFVYAIRALPLTWVLSYALVNPVVALMLGWAVLGEPLGARQWGGLGLVLLGVGTLLQGRPATTEIPVVAPPRRRLRLRRI